MMNCIPISSTSCSTRCHLILTKTTIIITILWSFRLHCFHPWILCNLSSLIMFSPWQFSLDETGDPRRVSFVSFTSHSLSKKEEGEEGEGESFLSLSLLRHWIRGRICPRVSRLTHSHPLLLILKNIHWDWDITSSFIDETAVKEWHHFDIKGYKHLEQQQQQEEWGLSSEVKPCPSVNCFFSQKQHTIQSVNWEKLVWSSFVISTQEWMHSRGNLFMKFEGVTKWKGSYVSWRRRSRRKKFPS